MEHIAGALKKLIKKQGMEKEINQQKATDIWEETVGKKISYSDWFSINRG